VELSIAIKLLPGLKKERSTVEKLVG